MPSEKTILIVDDTKENIDILISLLENYDILVAMDGKTAIEIVKQERIDLILLDIMMPEMDGFSVCESIKTLEHAKELPVIFLTVKSDESSIEKAYEKGGVDYVTKPFKPKELLSRVALHLKMHDMLFHLDALVKTEIAKQREQEQLLIEQSKLAAMGEMVDAIAHQWKQPISAISLAVDVAADRILHHEDFEGAILKCQERINKQIKHMISTLDTFRSFLRPGTKTHTFSLLQCIHKTIELTKDGLLQRHIKVEIDDQHDATITGIENEFQHILLSLIGNAKDIFHERSINNPTLFFSIHESESCITMDVVDNAGGIDEAIIADIFKPHVSSKKSGGSGVGLYLSQQIAKKNGAVITAQNSADGALFQIMIHKKPVLCN